MEEKVERLEAEAAVASKNYENEAKFTEMESNDSIDKELAELKAKINGSVVAAEPAEAPASQAKKG